MTRFEANYNPHLIYDASCLAKEYGYNRELKRFMQLTITTDRFHECNHSTCSDAFRSSQYISLVNVNTEACEQTNRLLRRVAHSTTFMSPELYMRSLTLFLADLNFCNNEKKKKVKMIFFALWFNLLASKNVTKFSDSLFFPQNLSLYFSLNFVTIALFISFCHKICH